MKILHIASFNGNIGDNAHHNGFRKNFQKLLSDNIEWTNLEIRNFYKSWNKMKFDLNFVEIANQYDLLVIGGGNFFEICHEYSSNGTTIDITIEILKKIKPSIFFNALGFDTHLGYTEETKKNFKIFIDYLLSNPEKYFVSFRNDGAQYNYRELYGKIPNNLYIIPDGGFFIDNIVPLMKKYSNFKYIGVQLACDMFEKRFKIFSYEDFCKKIADLCIKFLNENPNYKLLFFPHIYSDYKIIMDVTSHFNDFYLKNNVEIASYMTGQNSEKIFFNEYKKCDLLLGMRFHANVCAIALNIPTIAIVTYPQIYNLYKELNLLDRCIEVNQPDFFNELSELIEESIKKEKNLKKRYQEIKFNIEEQQEKNYTILKKWLSRNLKMENKNE